MGSAISFRDGNRGFQAGNIHGPVTNTFQLPPGTSREDPRTPQAPTKRYQPSHPERPETPPCPSAVIPFGRDTDFIEREIFDQIQTRCAAPGSWAVLVASAASGKYRTRRPQRTTNIVFWVHASNAARFEQGYRDIADCIRISGRLNPKANIFKLVHDWLHGSKELWLLVLDNVDDARFLVENQASGQGQPANDSRTASRPLRTYLPSCERGSILITTRNKEAALALVEYRDIVSVEPMDKVQAHALFEKKLGVQGVKGVNGNVAELAAALEYMLLAIVQAAAYISQRAPGCSVARYLEEFKKSERKRSSLLTHDDSQLRRDWEAKNSIIVTWQISFEHIQQTRPSAADLLSLMSFFDRQGIPEALIRSRREHGDAQRSQRAYGDDDWDSDKDDTSQLSAGDDVFEYDVETLRNFCFISVDTNGASFEMHAPVQLATRIWLNANGKLKQWKQQFIGNLRAEFPTGQYENWAACQALFAHARSAVEQQPEGQSSLAE
ncbi:hypothetical protein K458DRAFT_394168 [Lentithecium fluviatile CBS 122367]|uniref:NB-ARC domain-containing protein n=1 Tax=Lentithecium fluviatile CBS 122367 TaxID=1168545 RepID=A0A6G1IM14_9PLEO|nr:hypothetical protein K458DRAFT_394168 [Lentithecium fluviatile CBS 122367]